LRSAARFGALGAHVGHANGIDVLDFYQAQSKAREAFEVITKGRPSLGPITVADAAQRYLAWYAEQRKALRETEHALRVHILPRLGDKLIAELTAPQIRTWLEGLAATPARVRTSPFAKKQGYRKAPQTAEQKRARRATANRILGILKALLNKAFHDGLVNDDTAWRQVKPFARVDEPRIRFLTDADAARLVNACRPDVRPLVQAALLTGARVSELTALQARDVNAANGQIYIAHSKSGRPRFIPLNPEGATLFRELVVGKLGDALVLTKKDGKPWAKNHHVRSLLEACKAANIRPAISFHELRHYLPSLTMSSDTHSRGCLALRLRLTLQAKTTVARCRDRRAKKPLLSTRLSHAAGRLGALHQLHVNLWRLVDT
jgi:integrase